MVTQESLIIKKFCKGNRKSLFNIHPIGIDFEMPKAKFFYVLQFCIKTYGFVFLEERSDENNKIFLNSETNSVIILMINSNNWITELNRVIVYSDIDEQLSNFESLMTEMVDAYGAPHEWLIVDNDITACSWDASNGNTLSIGFNRSTNEVVCKYLRNICG